MRRLVIAALIALGAGGAQAQRPPEVGSKACRFSHRRADVETVRTVVARCLPTGTPRATVIEFLKSNDVDRRDEDDRITGHFKPVWRLIEGTVHLEFVFDANSRLKASNVTASYTFL